MLFKSLAVSALAGTALAQSLTDVLANTTELSNLTTYLGLFPDLVSTLSSLTNITLLAPNNDAFGKLLNSSAGAALTNNDTSLIQALFTYHVLNGTYSSFENTSFVHSILQPPTYANVTGGQVVEAVASGNSTSFITGLLATANSTGSPVTFNGGVVHIIDNVLTIPQNISETAVQAGLSSIAGALTALNLTETVDDLSDVTVFAPSNAAFQAIGSALPNLTTADLTTILTYHVVAGTVGYSTLLSNTTLTTVQGTNLNIEIIGSDVFVNSARVIIPNVLVANGVVHVIDGVLNPGNSTATPDPSASVPAPVFPGASSASAAPFTSGVPTPAASATSATASAPGATGASGSASSSAAAATGAAPMHTAAVGAAALFGGAALVLNM